MLETVQTRRFQESGTPEILEKFSSVAQLHTMFCLIDFFSKTALLILQRKLAISKKRYPLGKAGLTDILNPDITDGEPANNVGWAGYF